MTPIERRFFKYVEPVTESGCWIWMGGLGHGGYGQFMVTNDRLMMAHRVAYLMGGGELFNGFVLDHKCRVRCCVNPDHLEQVSPRENILRGIGEAAKNAVKTHCKRGHELDSSNIYFAKNGSRKCRVCMRMHVNNWRKRVATTQA